MTPDVNEQLDALFAADPAGADSVAVAQSRVRQLERELESLREGYEGVMREIIDEREARLDEQRQHNEVLEQQVAERSAELRLALKQAQSASAAKSQFLANMSHEIRTPMNAILGYTDLLAERELDTEAREWVDIINRNGRHLLALINDVLDLSKIEAGQMTLESITLDVRAIVEDVVALMRPRAQQKGLTLHRRIHTSIGGCRRGDPTRLRQVLVNLVGNAIKFTQSGEVCVQVEPVVDAENQRTELLRFDVIDSGIGIPPDALSRLFQPFTQVDLTTTRRFGGTGLGLTISRQLVEMMGGRITVDSEPGRGSRFTFEVLAPSTLCDGSEKSNTPAPRATGTTVERSVLVVEDGPDNRRLLHVLLKKLGCTVEMAEDGALGLAAVQAALDRGSGFDLILMDMQMPNVDGYTATQQLRDRGYTAPIIALTAHAMAEDRQKCLDAGCNDYLTKPIRREVLERALAQWCP